MHAAFSWKIWRRADRFIRAVVRIPISTKSCRSDFPAEARRRGRQLNGFEMSNVRSQKVRKQFRPRRKSTQDAVAKPHGAVQGQHQSGHPQRTARKAGMVAFI